MRLLVAGQGLLEAAQAGEHVGAVRGAAGRSSLWPQRTKTAWDFVEAGQGLLEAAQAAE